MKMISIIIAGFLFFTSAYAEENNGLNKEQRENIGDVLNNLTPEQKATLIAEAQKIAEITRNMTPEQREQLKQDTEKILKTINLHDADSNKIQ